MLGDGDKNGADATDDGGTAGGWNGDNEGENDGANSTSNAIGDGDSVVDFDAGDFLLLFSFL